MHLTLRLLNTIREFSATLLAIKGRCLIFSLPVQTMDMKNNFKNPQNIVSSF